MSSSVGNFSLCLSLCFAIVQFFISRKKNNRSVLQFNKIAVNGLLLCILVSFFSLMYTHIVSDFSVVNVFQNSHTTKQLSNSIGKTTSKHLKNEWKWSVGGAFWLHFWCILGVRGSILAPFRGSGAPMSAMVAPRGSGSSLGTHFGSILGSILGPFWDHFGCIFGVLVEGAFWVDFGSLFD